jgi:hypothetical protein
MVGATGTVPSDVTVQQVKQKMGQSIVDDEVVETHHHACIVVGDAPPAKEGGTPRLVVQVFGPSGPQGVRTVERDEFTPVSAV